MTLEPHISSLLNFFRWGSASIVMTTHLRNHLFASYDLVENPDALMTKLFYFLTQFGDEAVMIFFILSGFFIGGSILEKQRKGDFSFLEYLIDRLTRLYIVLIPALLLTAFIGLFLKYYAHYEISNLSLEILVGNLFFMQTIFFPEFANNAPLWSLPYEMFYYLLFPLLLLTYHRIHPQKYMIFIIILIILATQNILAYLSIWLLGVILYYIYNTQLTQLRSSKKWFISLKISLPLFLSMLVVRRLDLLDFGTKFIEDFFFSISFIFLIVSLLKHPPLRPLQFTYNNG